jgi:hypothetical protein
MKIQYRRSIILASCIIVSCLYGFAQSPPPHPRLLFSSSEISDLRGKAANTHAAIWKPILDQATILLSSSVTPMPTNAGLDSFYRAADNLTVIAFASLITNEDQFYDKTREYLISYASWSYWGDEQQLGGRDLGLAAMISSNAIAYDWMYDRLSVQERNTIRAALGRFTQDEYIAATTPFNSVWNNWWGKSYIQNHWSTNNSSIGIATLALEGEDNRTDTWLNHVITEMQKDTYILENMTDGSWHEGIQYQNMKFSAPMCFYLSLKRLKQIDIIPHSHFQRLVTWRIYNRLPGQVQYNREFSGCVFPYSSYVHAWGGWDKGGGTTLLHFIASQDRNAQAKWLAEKIRSESGLRAYWRAAEYVFEYLYYDASVASVQPDLPLSCTFTDLEGVIWRTGWNDSDLVFGLKSGAYGGRFAYNRYVNRLYPFDSGGDANVGHGHGDANSFYLFRGGVDLSSEMPDKPGPANESAVHNTILVDGRDQYRSEWHNLYEDTDGKLSAVFGTPGFDYLAADATNRYRTRGNGSHPIAPGAWWLNEFTRHVFFVRPNYFVIVDNLRSDSLHRYDWVAHFSEKKPAPVIVEGDWVKAPASVTDVLGIKVLTPAGFVYEIGESIHPYTNPPITKPYIRIRPAANAANVRFITLLYPTTQNDWTIKPDATLLAETESGCAVRVNDGNYTDHIFNYSATVDSLTAGEYYLRGTTATVIKSISDDLKKIFLGKSSMLSVASNERILVQTSGEKITLEAVYSGSSLALFSPDTIHHMIIYAPGVSTKEVTMNQISVYASKQGDYIILDDIWYAGVVPAVPVLYQNFPNPFNPNTTIQYSLPGVMHITMKIYNILGQEVRTVIDEIQVGGIKHVFWDSRNDQGQPVASGVYFYRLQAGSTMETKKLILVK